jgi:hypothetical protein
LARTWSAAASRVILSVPHLGGHVASVPVSGSAFHRNASVTGFCQVIARLALPLSAAAAEPPLRPHRAGMANDISIIVSEASPQPNAVARLLALWTRTDPKPDTQERLAPCGLTSMTPLPAISRRERRLSGSTGARRPAGTRA